MYLSKLQLNPTHPNVQRDLSDRHELHRTILCAFPSELPTHERVLFRVEVSRQRIDLLVQSQLLPDWSCLHRDYVIQIPQLRHVNTQHIQLGQALMFRLLANPTIKREGKRHALYQDEQCFDWLVRKGQQHGFRVGSNGYRHHVVGNVYGKKYQQVWHAVQFDGVLHVHNYEIFTQSLKNGIGSAKAFGFGLLSIPYPML
jgi:CRISPR system Cascade subunit CasE